jgi:hypothetical protein
MEVEQFRACPDDEARLEYLQEELEERYFDQYPEMVAESDKAWDMLHRLLCNGDLSYTDGPEPLRYTVLGGEPLYQGDDYIMSLKNPEQVKAVAAALATMTREEFDLRYDSVDEERYGFPKSRDDREYTWSWFGNVKKLFETAARKNRYVLFTVDQ